MVDRQEEVYEYYEKQRDFIERTITNPKLREHLLKELDLLTDEILAGIDTEGAPRGLGGSGEVSAKISKAAGDRVSFEEIQTDKEYLEAVNNNDMETAQRIVSRPSEIRRLI